MSSTGRGAVREPEDFYTSPSWTVRRLLEAWTPEFQGGVWVECGAGNGAIIRTVHAILGPQRFRSFELREEERPTLEAICPTTIGNFLHIDQPPEWANSVTVAIGNWPYAHAFEFLRQTKKLFPNAEIVNLLRQAFTASAKRYAFMRAHVPDKFELPDRPSFDGEGGDSADYAWMRWPRTWERRRGALEMLAQTSKVERSQDRGHHVVVVPPQKDMFS